MSDYRAWDRDYRAWDREEKLGPSPWKHDDPKRIAWEGAHGHDVRLKCYPEFGCRFAEIEITDEMVERAASAIALTLDYDLNLIPPMLRAAARRRHVRLARVALEAALGVPQ